jgi:3-phenylpropionate/cinnamic acid dioxygenase small subunit
MSAREAILHLINRYAFTIDTGDLEGFASLFDHGEWIMKDAEPIAGSQQVREAISRIRIYEDGTPRTKHVISNIDLDVDEEAGTAKSECYVTIFQQTEGFPLQPIFSGHYFYDFEQVAGAWRFKKRAIRYGLVGDLSAHLKAPSEIVPNA